jgi:hypothetical protein
MNLDQYVRDLREITAQHFDPVEITDLVAPSPRNLHNRRNCAAPNIANAMPSKASAFTCSMKSPITT